MEKVLKENNGWYCAADAEEGDPPLPTTLEIEIDGKKQSFDAEAVTNLVAQQAGATQKTQEVKEIVDAAAKYNLTPVEYIQQTEGAFAVISKLVDSKIIDDQGNVIVVEKKGDLPAGDPPPLPKPLVGEERTNAIVADALKSVVDPLKEGMKVLQEDNTKLIRAQLEMQVQGKHPTLSRDDISDLLVVASQDGKKNLMDHAQEMVERKKVGKAESRAEYAKEFNINLEEFDANKLREDDPGGGAAALFEGKKFSFDSRGKHSKDKNVVSPKNASHGFVQASQKG